MRPLLSQHMPDALQRPARTVVMAGNVVVDHRKRAERPHGHRPSRTWFDTTIVVPTLNEGANAAPLIERLTAAMRGRSVEVLFVDDSTDDTPQQISRVASHVDLPVRIIHRGGAERTGGLAGAVAAGIASSDSDFVVVMDGDLQHPPEMVPALRDAAEDVDLSIASRYDGGDPSGLGSTHRRWVSGAGTLVAQACFPRRVGRVCTDPMTGFFCVRRSAIDLSRMRPRGFKILLEVLTRHDLRVRELPLAFGERGAGVSKASWRTGVQFLHQVLSLRMGRFSRFAAVGAVGTAVNLAVMALLLEGPLQAHYLIAAIAAAEVSILHNFLLQERYVFGGLHDGGRSRPRRLAQHLAFNNAEALVRLPFLVLLVETVHLWPLMAQALTVAVACIARFGFMSRVVYRPRRQRPTAAPLRETVEV